VRSVGLTPNDLEAEAIARVDAIRQLREGGEAIRGLPRREREVLALLAWGDLSYGEIAEALGLPVGTVRSRLARARTRLGDAFPDPTAARPAEERL
jgi:RNA polymerase sigma factor (sigma-70 family)